MHCRKHSSPCLYEGLKPAPFLVLLNGFMADSEKGSARSRVLLNGFMAHSENGTSGIAKKTGMSAVRNNQCSPPLLNPIPLLTHKQARTRASWSPTATEFLALERRLDDMGREAAAREAKWQGAIEETHSL